MIVMRLLLLLFFILPTLAEAQVNADSFEEKADNGVNIYIRNDEYSPVTFEFKLDLTNVIATPATRKIVVPPRTERFLAYKLRLDPKASNWGYGYEYVTNIGDHVQTGYDKNFVYELPIAPGTDVRISQGYNGKYSHRGRLALDFNLTEGSPVHAARGGIVTEVVEHNDKGCGAERCTQYENRIVILHDDGTFAGYAHLQQNGAFVEPGDTVTTGQLIGKSGSTGFANGPHLHFSVYRQLMEKRSYVPTRFRLAGTRVPGKLEERGRYRRPKAG